MKDEMKLAARDSEVPVIRDVRDLPRKPVSLEAREVIGFTVLSTAMTLGAIICGVTAALTGTPSWAWGTAVCSFGAVAFSFMLGVNLPRPELDSTMNRLFEQMATLTAALGYENRRSETQRLDPELIGARLSGIQEQLARMSHPDSSSPAAASEMVEIQ